MPNLDGTGPQGKGPSTGRGLGPCEKGQNAGANRPGLGRGPGAGRGRGAGRGAGRGRGTGRGRNA